MLVFPQNSSLRVLFCFGYLDQLLIRTKHIIFFNDNFHQIFCSSLWRYRHDLKYELFISAHFCWLKVGVKQKKIVKKTKRIIGVKKILKIILIITKSMCFVLIKSWSKYAKQNETVKLKFCEKTSSVIQIKIQKTYRLSQPQVKSSSEINVIISAFRSLEKSSCFSLFLSLLSDITSFY